MVLLTAFIVTVLAGDLAAVAIAEIVEYFNKTVSLMVFLALFVGVIPIAWRIAVRATEPDGMFTRWMARKP
jgi:energy-converting hydrogenase Eha subunit E